MTIIRLREPGIRILLLAMAVALSACAAGGPQSAAPATDSAAQTAQTQSLPQRVGTLPPQVLQDGACGMFLWARGSRARLVFFTSNTDNEGHIVLDGRDVGLPRSVADGDFLFGQYTRQQFAGDALTLSLSVQPDPESRMIGGTVVRHGTLRIEDRAGWSLVLPVAGMIACKSA